MAQHDMNIANQGFPAFRSDLNNALSAIQTNHSGTSRPTGAVAGQIWLDTTNATNPTLKFFDGTDDISLATIDYSANTVNWLDSTVSVTGLATTATGTVLTLSDSATTQTVNFIIDNEKEIRFNEADANGSNYVALKAPASLASDVTFTLPSADGTADQVLKTDGSGNLSFTDVSGGISWQSSIVTGSTLTAVAGNGYWIDTTSNACTVTLPSSASVGDQIILVDYDRTWNTNNLTIDLNGLNYQGGTDNPVYNTNGQTVNIVYSGATNGWIPISDDDVANEGTLPPYSADFLVIAGGGGGGIGNTSGGGGGAGGYRNSYSTESSGGGGSAESSITLNPNTVYTITVGSGGAGASGPSASPGTNGNNSSISGTGLTTITSDGGGGGGSTGSGNSGGSGGGGGSTTDSSEKSGGSGTANQGYAGGLGRHVPGSYEGGGGGGGAGAVGGNYTAGPPNIGGAGGNGVASTITGSSITRGGGGGGSGANDAAGGSGGGGQGSPNYTSGTANTGGGGGAGSALGAGSGGSGVVILRVPTANYSGTTTGSPTVTTNGTDTILTFNASGSYTG